MPRNGLRFDRIPFWRSDVLRLSVAIASLLGALLVISFILNPLFISKDALKGKQKGDSAAELHQQAEDKARRTGSIVFMTQAKMCEELRFDNVAEQVLSVADIDCEEWLTRTNAMDAKTAKAANMRSVLDSFKK